MPSQVGNGFATLVKDQLREQRITQAELARRIGVSRQRINKILNSDNFRISTMAKISIALDRELKINFFE